MSVLLQKIGSAQTISCCDPKVQLFLTKDKTDWDKAYSYTPPPPHTFFGLLSLLFLLPVGMVTTLWASRGRTWRQFPAGERDISVNQSA